MRQFRQGDVFIFSATESPKEGTEVARESGKVVLAHGEATGHSHALGAKSASLWAFGNIDDRLLKLPKISTLKHEEHAEIKLPSGQYWIRIQRQYVRGRTRNVED